MARIRVNFTLDARAYNVLKAATPKNKSMSELVSQLILKTFEKPIKSWEREAREYAIKINELQNKIKAAKKDEKS